MSFLGKLFGRKSDPEAKPELPTVAPQIGQLGEEVMYPVDAQHIVCLNGPCRYLMETFEPLDAMQIPGQAPLRETIRLCRAITPTHDITEATIFDCTTWDPITAAERQQLTQIRKQFPDRKWYYIEEDSDADE